jgi:hypothetical protein
MYCRKIGDSENEHGHVGECSCSGGPNIFKVVALFDVAEGLVTLPAGEVYLHNMLYGFLGNSSITSRGLSRTPSSRRVLGRGVSISCICNLFYHNDRKNSGNSFKNARGQLVEISFFSDYKQLAIIGWKKSGNSSEFFLDICFGIVCN